jgi:ABC-type transport system involved in multi-copper enzyme maturation permease subunit
MNSEWRSLLWKEWREQRWILALMLAACVVAALVMVACFQDWAAGVAGAGGMIGLGVPAVAIFVGAGVAAGERSRRTLSFLQGLPVSTRRAALAKLIVAVAVVMGPALITCAAVMGHYLIRAALSAYWVFDQTLEPIADWTFPLAFAALVSGLAATSLMLWTAAAGVNHVDELRAGAIGLLVIASVWGVIAYVSYQYSIETSTAWPRWLVTASGGAPAGISDTNFFDVNPGPGWLSRMWRDSWPRFVVYLVAHSVLATAYVARFGRRAAPLRVYQSPPRTAPAQPSCLAAPRRTRVGAIAWKQFRESAPLAALGGLVIAIVAPIVSSAIEDMAATEFYETWQMTAVSAWLMAGIFTCVVAGIGLFYDDLRPELYTFWRSRPINIDSWFWTKLLMGLPITVGVLAAAPLVTVGIISWVATGLPKPLGEPSFQVIVLAGLLLHAVMFALAALAMVLVRQPVLAALATFFSSILAAMLLAWWYDDELALGLGVWALGAGAVIGLSLMAWQAVRRDWGWGGAS